MSSGGRWPAPPLTLPCATFILRSGGRRQPPALCLHLKFRRSAPTSHTSPPSRGPMVGATLPCHASNPSSGDRCAYALPPPRAPATGATLLRPASTPSFDGRRHPPAPRIHLELLPFFAKLAFFQRSHPPGAKLRMPPSFLRKARLFPVQRFV